VSYVTFWRLLEAKRPTPASAQTAGICLNVSIVMYTVVLFLSRANLIYLEFIQNPIVRAFLIAAPYQVLRTIVLPEAPVRRRGHNAVDRVIGQLIHVAAIIV
jgi:hypothetical protein